MFFSKRKRRKTSGNLKLRYINIVLKKWNGAICYLCRVVSFITACGTAFVVIKQSS